MNIFASWNILIIARSLFRNDDVKFESDDGLLLSVRINFLQ